MGCSIAFGFLYAVVFIFRDRLFSNAGPGKRVLGLCVVRTTDGQSPLGFGQAFIRGLTLIPSLICSIFRCHTATR